ncbi:hypothetical protein SLE2022_199260 [Rubroshorea leprosula]
MKKPYLGSLLFLFFLLSFTFHVHSQSTPDAEAMQALNSSLKIPSSLDWSDSDPCKWAGVQCSSGTNRVTRIQIGNKNVAGTLPPDLKNLSALTVLQVMNNQLTGAIPSLAALSSLQEANFSNNHFTSFPADFFVGLTSLQTVVLDYNPFAPWEIPASLKEATALQSFSAISANLTGTIPDIFGSGIFSNLIQLHLSFNQLEGGLPASFSGSMIQSLWLKGMKLNGWIQVLQNMTSLTEVWLDGNQFTGPLPDFSQLTQLANLSLRDNLFTGVVPMSLVDLQSLYVVNLTNNLLQGPTPKFAAAHVDILTDSNRFCLSDPGVACDNRVNILLSIVEAVSYPATLADSWKGNDPCSLWRGITCDSNGNITAVNFKNLGLSGTISSNFSMLTSLTTLDLANNNLTGTIPSELTNLASLSKLDVSDNNLYGKVPTFKQNLDVITAGNPNIGKNAPPPPASPGTPDSTGGGSPASSQKKSQTAKVAGSLVGAICGLGAVGMGIFLYATKQKHSSTVQSPNTAVIHRYHSGDQEVVKVISTQVLRTATNNFGEENILGRGGFGTVYRGELRGGTKIAVKRMKSSIMNEKALAEFKSEIAVLTKVRHRNLTALLGYCLDGNERLLVYECMPQGTLSRHLFNWKEEGLKPLEWTRRLIIALDVARGLEYLHGLARQSFIHRDLKPANILLGDDMHAKIADFGLVRLVPDGKYSVDTRIAGTFGYLAPEYGVTGRVTMKVDVFSFGVILMELITGRRALDETQSEDSLHVVAWFRRMHVNKDTFQQAIDPTIELDEDTLASISTVAELAGHCSAEDPNQRPYMGHTVNVLSSLVEVWKPAEPDSIDSNDMYGTDSDMTISLELIDRQSY